MHAAFLGAFRAILVSRGWGAKHFFFSTAPSSFGILLLPLAARQGDLKGMGESAALAQTANLPKD